MNFLVDAQLPPALAFKLYTLASFRNCAAPAGLSGGFPLSKQALEQRIGPAARRFRELCLREVLTRRLHGKPGGDHCLLGSFQRVLILDSTTLALPEKWAALFPGPRNQSQRPGAQLKIQAVLDLCVHRWVATLSQKSRNISLSRITGSTDSWPL